MMVQPQLHDEEGPIVMAPERCDILCGSGHFVFNHPGNVQFRGIVEKRAEDYANAPTRAVKTRVVKSIVFEVRATGARILKKHPIHLWWNVVGESDPKVLRDKTTHHLRAFLTKRSAGGGVPGPALEEPHLVFDDRLDQGEQQLVNNAGIFGAYFEISQHLENQQIVDSAAGSTMYSVRTIQEMQAAPLQLTECQLPDKSWMRSLFSAMAGEPSVDD